MTHVIDGALSRRRARVYVRQYGIWLALMVILGAEVAWAIPKSHVLRFSDTPVLKTPTSNGQLADSAGGGK